MKPVKKMTVSEMDHVNALIDISTRIDRLELTERERALAYFRYLEREATADLSGYAQRFDELIREADRIEILRRIKACALAVRREARGC